MNKNVRFKINKDNKIVVLFTKAKNIFLKKDRAFRMLKKGSSIKEPVINSKIHRSIK